MTPFEASLQRVRRIQRAIWIGLIFIIAGWAAVLFAGLRAFWKWT